MINLVQKADCEEAISQTKHQARMLEIMYYVLYCLVGIFRMSWKEKQILFIFHDILSRKVVTKFTSCRVRTLRIGPGNSVGDRTWNLQLIPRGMIMIYINQFFLSDKQWNWYEVITIGFLQKLKSKKKKKCKPRLRCSSVTLNVLLMLPIMAQAMLLLQKVKKLFYVWITLDKMVSENDLISILQQTRSCKMRICPGYS